MTREKNVENPTLCLVISLLLLSELLLEAEPLVEGVVQLLLSFSLCSNLN